MAQLISNLPVGTKVKIQEYSGGDILTRNYIVILKAEDNHYGNDKVLMLREMGYPIDNVRVVDNDLYYENCTIDTYMSNEFYNRFNDATKAVIANSTVKINTLITDTEYQISRKVFAYSVSELNSSIKREDLPFIPYFTTANRKFKIDGGRVTSFTATRSNTANPSNPQFYVVYPDTGAVNNSRAPGYVAAFRPMMNIYSTCMVSDEADEDGAYMLIPNPDDPYLKVDFKCNMGTVNSRPKKIRIDLTAEGEPEVTSIKVCNNYLDTSPVWEEMTVGTAHTFVNDTKETADWCIGVWVQARGENTIRVYEPMCVYQI